MRCGLFPRDLVCYPKQSNCRAILLNTKHIKYEYDKPEKEKINCSFIPEVLKEMISECKPGCSIRELCILGDKKLTEETGKAYKKDKKLAKGRIIYAP